MTAFWETKVAVVTGGSSGLGRAVAEALGQAGVNVVLAARDGDRLVKTASRMRDKGNDVVTVPTDVTVSADVDRLIHQTLERYGRLDVLVNCAGRSARGKLDETTAEAFDDLLQLNFLGAVRCTRAALPYLLKSRGHVVNIGSLAAKTAWPLMGGYPASKFPLAAYSQQLRLEFGPQGLHVLLVCPGPLMRTDAGTRYADQTSSLPATAAKPGAGAPLSAIPPATVAAKILKYCQRRKPELVMPAKARLLFVLSALSPRLGDWLIRKKVKSD